MSVAPRICVPTVKFLCSSLEGQSLEMLSGFWRPLIAGKMCLFFSWAQRKLLSLYFTATVFLLLRTTKPYIFHVPLELFPQSFIHKRPQLCKVHLQSCLTKKPIKFIALLSFYLRNKPLCKPSFRFLCHFMIIFIVAKALGLTHGLLFLFKPPWKSSHGKLWIMHMTYAACLSEGTEEPDSNLHFWSCRRETGNFRQEFLGLWGQSKKRKFREAPAEFRIGWKTEDGVQSWPEMKYNPADVTINS